MQNIKADCKNNKNYCQPQAYFTGYRDCFACLDVISHGDNEEYKCDCGEYEFYRGHYVHETAL